MTGERDTRTVIKGVGTVCTNSKRVGTPAIVEAVVVGCGSRSGAAGNVGDKESEKERR